MTASVVHLDAHEQPSEEMRAEWKSFSRADQAALLADPRIDDPRLPLEDNGFRQTGAAIPRAQLADAFARLRPEFGAEARGDVPIIHHPLLPGASPRDTQSDTPNHSDCPPRHHDTSRPQQSHPPNQPPSALLPPLPSSSSPSSQTPPSQTSSPQNASFFSYSPESPPNFIPKDPSVHRPLSIKQVLQRRLHWVTLGGQYDWTNRVYPAEAPPQFPADLSGFLLTLFPDTLAQAAIVNFYTPGDTMMMHRDVSEETDKGLVSLSLGCDGLFMIAPNGQQGELSDKDKDKKYLLLRLRSGDAIYMTQESRYAWHGVPKVLKGTCPDYLAEWPATGENSEFEEWRGWMQSKRINLNVRQVKD
ncbi:Alpha-ketoglutarate-dependent dioxygenase abh1 [Cladobotryum mycophilum]|uniref:Alpha-ketoglutarate-dependent dioxygenase abh1 n=1 Tax=Cladobotryum mycophilum TaxID=491253 RepID=A0ABR0SWQ9_9HYPO